MDNISKTSSISVDKSYRNHGPATEGGTPISVNRLTQGAGALGQEGIIHSVSRRGGTGATAQESATTSPSNADLPKATTVNSVHTYPDEGVKLSDRELEDLCDQESIADPVQVKQSLNYANEQAELHRQDQPKQYRYAERSDIVDIERECTPAKTASISCLETEGLPDFPNGGVTAAKGGRTEMQDSHLATKLSVKVGNSKTFPIMGVFDGHGKQGEKASSFVKDNIVQELEAELTECNLGDLKETRNALFAGMNELGEKVRSLFKGGTTACAAVVLDDGDSKTIWILNVGDSRAFVGNKDHTCVQLSTDHNCRDLFDRQGIKEWKRQNQDENSFRAYSSGEDDVYKKMIKPAKRDRLVENYIRNGRIPLDGEVVAIPGGAEKQYDVNNARVGDTQVYRALGHDKLPYTPTITTHNITPNTKFLFIGCDGIYDELTTDDVSKIINDKLTENPTATGTEISEHVVTAAYAAGSQDNLSAMFIPVQDLIAQTGKTV